MELSNDLFSVVQAHFGMILATLLVLLMILSGIYWSLSKQNSEDDDESAGVIPVSFHRNETKELLQNDNSGKELEVEKKKEEETKAPEVYGKLFLLGEKLKRTRQMAAQQKDVAQDETVDSVFEAGRHAMHEGQWEMGKKYFEELLKIKSNHAAANLQLAIACYELGDLQSAEKHLQESDAQHPLAAKVFRKHLAFRA
jgi:hypothetical protein